MRDLAHTIDELKRFVGVNTRLRQPLARLLWELQKSMEYGEFGKFCERFVKEVDTKSTPFDTKTVYHHAKWGSVLEDLASCSTNPKTAEQTGDYDYIDASLPLTVSLSKILSRLPKHARQEVWKKARAESKSGEPSLKELEQARQSLYPKLPTSSAIIED